MVISLQGVTSSFQRVKHWLKVSEHIFEILALIGMLWYYFARLVITNLTCGQSVILALFFDWEIYLHPSKHFCTKIYTHSPYNILKIV